MAEHSEGSVRDQQLAKAIERELSRILASAADNRLQLIEIVRVECRSRGHHFLIVFGPPHGTPEQVTEIEGPENVHKLLTTAHGYIRSGLASSLNLKNVPNLSFEPDPVRWAEWSDFTS